MIECSSCGTGLAAHQSRCPTCGKTTAHYHRQRRCLHCGAPVAERAITCMMCHQPVDSLPLSTSFFSGSWASIGLGVLIIVGIVWWVTGSQGEVNRVAQAEENFTPTATATFTPTPTNTGTPTATPTLTPTPTPTPRTHTVVAGETLIYLAQQYGVDMDELAALNNIQDVRSLRSGQTLIIPPSQNAVAPADSLPNLMVYVIESGDTISSIAYEFGTPIDAILAANPNLNIDLIYPGQEIIVPLSTPTPTSTPTPLPSSTPTPGPGYPLPQLLTPASGQVIDSPTLLLNWTSPRLLTSSEYYVLQLTWPTGATTEHWVKNSSWRIARSERLAGGVITWTVTVKQQTGVNAQGTPTGPRLSPAGQPRTFEWR